MWMCRQVWVNAVNTCRYMFKPENKKNSYLFIMCCYFFYEEGTSIKQMLPAKWICKEMQSLNSLLFTLQKHAYLNILRILPPKNENFQMKNSGGFHISAQNIECGVLLEPHVHANPDL